MTDQSTKSDAHLCAYCKKPTPPEGGAWRDEHTFQNGTVVQTREDGWRRAGRNYFCPQPQNPADPDHISVYMLPTTVADAIRRAGGTIQAEYRTPEQ